MKTMEAPTRSVKSARPKPAPEVHGVCRLTLTIGETDYSAQPIRSDWHARAYQLRKLDGSEVVYHVAAGEHGPECDCPDATFRDRKCKHMGAMVAIGLLPTGPAPRPALVPGVNRVRDEFDS